MEAELKRLQAENGRLLEQNGRLNELLQVPEILDFVKAVQLEAAHQRKRWGDDHDAGKSDADWFWLIGYLGGKALHNPFEQGCSACDGGALENGSQCSKCEKSELEKQLHRIITVAAAAANWHAQKLGKTNMRPGIEPPKEGT